jgi:hypothetical protein
MGTLFGADRRPEHSAPHEREQRSCYTLGRVVHHPVLGDPAKWQPSSSMRVKGSLLAARPRYVRETWGPAAVEQLAPRLGDEAKQALTADLLPFRWYPMALMVEIDQAIVEGPMQGDVTRMKTFGAAIARYDLSTLYKMLFRLGTPAFVVKRLDIAYATYIKGGRVRVQVPSPNRTRVELHETALPKYLCTHGIAGWITAALELSGAEGVHVEESACVHDGAPHCHWEGRWS